MCVTLLGYAVSYYLGFFNNLFFTSYLSILLTTTETHPVQYSIEAASVNYYHNGMISTGNDTILRLPVSVQNDDQHKGIYLTTNSDKVTVIGQNLGPFGSDSYLALPIINLGDIDYVYYGISVPKTFHNKYFPSFNSILMVGTEDNTVMKLTVTQSVDISMSIGTLIPGREYCFVINRLQTVYVRSLEDLSGTKIVTNKPVSVFSGHQHYLIEQIPPTELWGNTYYTAPFANRTLYTIKLLSAYNSTIVNIYCNNVMELYTMNEGQFVNKTVLSQQYCAIYSNNKILVVQFSHGGAQKSGLDDPAMILVPSVNQYLNILTFSTIRNPLSSPYHHYINIIVMTQYYQPNMIYLISGGVNMSLSTQQWRPIQVNGTTKAYTTQVNISEGVAEIFHSNSTAKLMVIVYGFSRYDNRYGHIGGILLHAG